MAIAKHTKISNLILPAFKSLYQASKTFQVAKGGRGSGKSTTIAIKIVMLVIKYRVNALIVRRVGATLRKSVYEQIKEAIAVMGVETYFKCTDSRLEIVYKPTGQEIMFRGADDAGKIKSVKTSKYPIGILWIEELADFMEPGPIDVIIDSVIRAEIGFKYQVFFSYNPPKRKSNWANKRYNSKIAIPQDTFIHHSTSFDNTYLAAAFFARAREWEAKNINYFKWNYLGEPLGGGLIPFNNLTFKKIEPDLIKTFDNNIQGLDWGFGVDPTVFTRSHFSRKQRKLWVYGEKYETKLHNIHLAKWIKDMQYNDTRIVADSEDSFRIANLKSHGIRVVPAKKGAGSIESGLEWLDSLEEIIIDPYLCPSTAKEFEISEYATDKDGNLLPRLDPRLPDHGIDSIRYATEREQVITKSLEEKYK